METTHKFYIVDLVRNRPKSELVEIPKYPVRMEITVSTNDKNPPPESLLKRLEEEAREALEAKERGITLYAFIVAKQVNDLLGGGKPDVDDHPKAVYIASIANQKIKKLLDSAKADADKKVKERLEREKKDNENLSEARVKTAIFFATSVIKLATNGLKLTASHGADLSAIASIVGTLITLQAMVIQLGKKESQLQKDLEAALSAYITAKKKVTSPKKTSKDVDNAAGKAETARKYYRDHLTKFRQKIDLVSVNAGKLQKEMKAATTLKEGVKAGAACMKLKSEVRVMTEILTKREHYLADMQDMFTKNEGKVDDRTVMDKLKAFNRETIFEKATSLSATVGDIKSIFDSIKELAV
ncbi:hypothetical protein [Agrobacterium sp. B1(2019)]|uniref:hypothetical protein n=1 Tax=Agrobacterium sp. B1(2019) TaxID=2607032 RepID=UPI0011EEA164|nr:hypothetical protein [Agrobacterium sp. B1(2019)]TZG32229.1 hypothetical protein AGR1_24900 [Agrobacterium sp. B1(2019)]